MLPSLDLPCLCHTLYLDCRLLSMPAIWAKLRKVKKSLSPKAFGMLAGGIGITPMFKVTRTVLENPKDETKIYLINANIAHEDIFLKEQLDNFQKNYPDQFSVHNVLEKPPQDWNGSAGYISKDLVKSHCPAPASDIQIL